MKNDVGELLVGIRRTLRSFVRFPYGLAEDPYGQAEGMMMPVVAGEDGIWSNIKGTVRPESVVEAVMQAEMGNPFEVVYYPRTGLPNFVVDAETVEAAMRVRWPPGTPIKMWVEVGDVSIMTHGKVSGMAVRDPVLWPNSPGRMLQIRFAKQAHSLNKGNTVHEAPATARNWEPHEEIPYLLHHSSSQKPF